MSRKHITDRQVVEAARDFHRDAESPHRLFGTELLAARTRQPLKVCEAAYLRAYRRGLIVPGTSIRSAWPTEKGLALLQEATA